MKDTASTAKGKAAKNGQQPAPGAALPLFFNQPVPLQPNRHAGAGIRMNLAADFARATNSIPLTVGEFAEAAKSYPIVFTAQEPVMPVLIVGLEQENAFLTKEGKWAQDVYVPAYVRKYPFVFMESDTDQLTLCVDESASAYIEKAEEGDVKLFDGEEPSEYTRGILSFCSAFQEQYMVTRRFCDMLKEMELLTPSRSDVQLADGRKLSMSGFQMIDQEKLHQLSDAQIVELHKSGFLPLVYYALLSASNWQQVINQAYTSNAA